MEQHKTHHSSKQIREALKVAGIQPSASRMAIAAFVWNTTSHPTAEEVKKEVDEQEKKAKAEKPKPEKQEESENNE